jgi:hypothetical protein
MRGLAPHTVRTLLFLNVMDFALGSFFLYLAVIAGNALIQCLWHGVVYAYLHWAWWGQIPAFYFSWCALLLVVIAAAYVISLGCMILRQGWDDIIFVWTHREKRA